MTVHKDIAEYQPKVVGKMTGRTLISIVGALGVSVLTGVYLYFVLGLTPGGSDENLSDNSRILYTQSVVVLEELISKFLYNIGND